jgi:hypothetical protein
MVSGNHELPELSWVLMSVSARSKDRIWKTSRPPPASPIVNEVEFVAAGVRAKDLTGKQ